MCRPCLGKAPAANSHTGLVVSGPGEKTPSQLASLPRLLDSTDSEGLLHVDEGDGDHRDDEDVHAEKNFVA